MGRMFRTASFGPTVPHRLKSQLGAAAFRKGARVSGPLGAPSRLPFGALPLGDANLVPLGTREAQSVSREPTPAPEVRRRLRALGLLPDNVGALLRRGSRFAREAHTFFAWAQAEPVPVVEWWDKGLLAHGSLEQDVPQLPEGVLPPAPSQLLHLLSGQGRPASKPHGGDDELMADEYQGLPAGGERDALGPSSLSLGSGLPAAVAMGGEPLVEAAALAAQGELGPYHLKEARVRHGLQAMEVMRSLISLVYALPHCDADHALRGAPGAPGAPRGSSSTSAPGKDTALLEACESLVQMGGAYHTSVLVAPLTCYSPSSSRPRS
jgi:hypothetical protein